MTLCKDPVRPDSRSRNGSHPANAFSIMILDDDHNICRLVQASLEGQGYKVRSANQGFEALAALAQDPPHLIIADFFMPGMTGLEFLVRARDKVPYAAKILLTGQANIQMAMDAVNRGEVNRIITKPFEPAVLIDAVRECLNQVKLRIENMELLEKSRLQNEALTEWNRTLEKEVDIRTRHLKRITEATVFSLAELAESRAQDIGGHLRRMQEYTRALTETMIKKKNRPNHLSEAYLHDLIFSTLLHDIGKVGIPDGILFKPGKLTDAEFMVMKTHTIIGQVTIQKAQEYIGDQSFLSLGIAVAGFHHERWDGKGYPKGLSGETIPFAARVVAIADVYDALTTQRVYKSAWSHEEAIQYIIDGAGTQFDPELTAILTEVEGEFMKVRENFEG